MRAPLGLKRTVEVGKVQQSFSHGRSNTVIVETKKARPPAEPQPEGAPAAAPVADEDEEGRSARARHSHGHAPAKRPEPARPARGREEHRRERGKLTVSRALGEDGDARARSLAALRR